MSEQITGELLDGHVAVIRIDSPPNNHLRAGTLADLNEAIEAARTEGARAAVLTSTGRNFCAGADFSEGGVGGGDPEARRIFYEDALRLYGSPLPLVAAIQGAAVGGGLGLALACDVRVVTPTTHLSAPFVRLGTSPGFALTASLPIVVGPAAATELILTGRRVYGAESIGMGLAHRCVGEEELLPVATTMARSIAGAAPLAVAEVRSMLQGRALPALRAALEDELAAQARLRETADFSEGVAAMLARRPPVFRSE